MMCRTAKLVLLAAAAFLLATVPVANAGPRPCIRAAKADAKDCVADCKETFQAAKDGCLNRDHDCVEGCRADRAQCRLDTGFDAAIDGCNSLLDAARQACRDQGKTGDALDRCVDLAQVEAFQCRDPVRELAKPLLKQCRKDFRACAMACPAPNPPTSVNPAQCLIAAKNAVIACLLDCREDLQLGRDICLDRDHACVEDCRTIRHDVCIQPIRDQFILDVAACNQTRDDNIRDDCDVRFPAPRDPAAEIFWNLCVDDYQVTAFVCRDNAHEAARPGLRNCRDQFKTCALGCGPLVP